MVEDSGELLFACDLTVLKYAFGKNTNMNGVNLRRSTLANFRHSDLMFLSGARKENLVEAYRKCMPLVGVSSFTFITSEIAYPFNLNVDSVLLAHWFFFMLFIILAIGIKKGGCKSL